jgi:hypothetical protein
MEEPIASYYFKYGPNGLADIYVIGIKEVPSQPFMLPNTQLFGASQQGADYLCNLLFPPNTIKITPLAMFRKLLPSQR